MTRALGSANRFPFVPAVNNSAPMLAAWAQADCIDGRLHVLHRVIDAQSGRHAAARRVDIEIDVFLRVLSLQEQQLCDDEVGEHIVDRRPEENDAILQEP